MLPELDDRSLASTASGESEFVRRGVVPSAGGHHSHHLLPSHPVRPLLSTSFDQSRVYRIILYVVDVDCMHQMPRRCPDKTRGGRCWRPAAGAAGAARGRRGGSEVGWQDWVANCNEAIAEDGAAIWHGLEDASRQVEWVLIWNGSLGDSILVAASEVRRSFLPKNTQGES